MKPVDTSLVRAEVAFTPDKDGRYFDLIYELCDEVDRQRAELEALTLTLLKEGHD